MVIGIEAETPQPLSLRDKIATRVSSGPHFLRGGEEGYPRLQRGGAVYLEVPTQSIMDMMDGLPEEFVSEMPSDPQRKARLILKSKGSLRVAQLTVFPKDFETAASTWRLEMPDGQEPHVSYGRGKHSPHNPSFSDFFSGLIDISRPWRRTLEDYLDVAAEWTKGWPEQERSQTQEAVRIAYEQLGKIRRRSHEPQTEHAYETARILVEEMGVKDPAIIIGAWLHDVPEDGQGYRQFNLEDGDPPEAIIRHSLYEEQTIEKLARRVGFEGAALGMAVSRPKAEGFEIKSRQKGYEKYYSRFPENIRAILIKLADRLHNIRTLWAMPFANQRMTIIETKTIYWPIFELAREQYPEAVDYGLVELDKEMRGLVASNPKLKIDYDSL